MNIFLQALQRSAIGLLIVSATPAFAQDVPPAQPANPYEQGDAPSATTSPPDDADEGNETPAGAASPRRRRGGTGVDGLLRDSQTREPIIEAPIQVIGGPRVFTDIDGRFSLDLAPGTYRLRIRYDLYQPTRVNNVVVRAGQRTRVTIRLRVDPQGELAEVVVRARANRANAATQIQMRRDAAVAQDAISSEEIQRSGDSNAGEAARRVVGTQVSGNYLVVRGLSGRYTTSTLNGAPIPSTDPDQPGVQLDLFPASVLTSLTVLKTFSPDLLGDSAGGAIQIATRDFPDHFQLTMSGSFAVNSETTFRNAMRGPTSGCDYLAFDCNLRALPRSVPRTYAALANEGVSQDEVNDFARGFRGRSWRLGSETLPPNFRVGINVGDSLRVDGRRLGYLLNVGYGNSTQRLNEVIRRVQIVGDVTPQVVGYPNPPIARESVSQTAQWNGLATVAYELAPQHDIALTSLFSLASDDYTGVQTGYDNSTDATFEQRRMRYVQRLLWFSQLSGDHQRNLPWNARLKWQINGSLGSRDEPDTRDLTRYQVGGADAPFFWRPTSGSGERLFLGLNYREYGGSSDITIPSDTLSVKFGYLARRSERKFTLRRFTFTYSPDVPPNALGVMEPEEIFHPDNIGPGIWLFERTRGSDGYESSVELHAAYAMADWKITDSLRVVGGVRAESFRQVITSSSPFGATQATDDNTTRRTDVDPLPALTAIFSVTPEMAIRASYGSTIARPQVRELAPYLYPDFVRSRTIAGNPGLQRTRIESFDARWEWFPAAGEVFAVSLFYKFFSSPIEMVVIDDNNSFTFQNVQGAENFGAELESRFSLGRLHSSLNDVTFGANLTLLYSQVQMNAEQRGLATNAQRALAGQSPFVTNLFLGFAPNGTGLSFNLAYNVAGRKITDAGRQGLPDVYQEPIHSLDFAFAWEVDSHLTLRANIENLLYQGTTLEQGGITIQAFNPGLTASIGVSFTP